MDEEDEEEESNQTSSKIDPNHLPPTLQWLTVDPGRQYIGSFHPQDPNTWFDDAYSKEKLTTTTSTTNYSTFNFGHFPVLGLGLGGGGGAASPPFMPLPAFSLAQQHLPVLPMPLMPPAKPVCMYGTGCYRKVEKKERNGI